jgi:hypothetical protein
MAQARLLVGPTTTTTRREGGVANEIYQIIFYVIDLLLSRGVLLGANHQVVDTLVPLDHLP